MKKFLLVLMVFLLFPLTTFASIGVGVGTGKIQIDEYLKPGGIYELPAIVVLNTGDEPSEYGMSIEYFEKQPEMKPDHTWFDFTPATFHLDPAKAISVSTILHLPVRTAPGKYFAFVEAHPVKKDVAGQATIGVAAAAKLYFTVAPANIWEGFYYRASSFIVRSSPWSYIVGGVIALAILILIIRRFVSLNITIGKRSEK
ncbi:hypothetical protein EXS71_03930 [Candidatus Uhrbacteria bacterium]|nr:hypothetical protein [Candidatus Uhrbacteria bacterium]